LSPRMGRSRDFRRPCAVRFAPLQGGVGRGTSCHTRATRGDSNGQWRSLLTTAGRRPRPVAGHHWRVPKLQINTDASGGPSLRDGSGLGLGSGGGHQSAGIPSRRRQRHSGPGAGGLCRSAAGCSTWTAVPGPLRGKLADVTGYPLPAFISCGKERRPYGYPTFT
jgi:hypothetical protein